MSTEATPAERVRVGDRITIAPRGKRGIWTAEFYFEGQHRHRSLKTANKKIASKRALVLEAELLGGDYARPVRPMSVADAIEQFMGNRRSEGRASKTLVKYQGELDLFAKALARRGAHTLKQITPHLFDLYRVERGKERSAKTVYGAMIIVKTFVRWCVGRELLERDPLRGSRVAEPYVAPKRVPRTEQVRAILGAAKSQRQVQLAMLAYTGLRGRAADAPPAGR